MMNLRQVTWLAARLRTATCFHRRFTTATTLLSPLLKNRLCYYNRFYCCQWFPLTFSFQYRTLNNHAMSLERNSFFTTTQENNNAIASTASSFFGSVCARGMAGHSKWQNIRHIKGAKDKQKSELSTRFAQRLRIAVKEGGKDPKFNSKLERIIADAKKSDMPNAMIETAIKSADVIGAGPSIAEVKFIGNCVLVVEIFTTKLQLTRNEIQAISRKYGGRIENGCSEDIFDKKGIIHVTTTKEPNMETALELAIEVGAEDVSVESDEDDVPFLEFICGPRDLHMVRKALEAENYNVTYSEFEYLPNLTYPLDANAIATLERLVHRLYQLQDVVKVFDNAALLE